MFLPALSIVAPVFALIALGYGAAKLRLVGSTAGAGLSEFVFVLAIPALLFRTVAGAAFPPVNPVPYWLAYFTGLSVAWLIASMAARRLGRDAREAAVIGFAAAQSNTVLVGIPLVLGTIGEAGTVPTVLLLAVHLPVTMTVVSVLIARGETSRESPLRLVRSLVLHPILLAIGLGVAWRQTGLAIPGLMQSVLKFLGDAAAPSALVAMGMSMSNAALSGNFRLIGLVAALKLVVHPLLVYVLAVPVFHLPPIFAAAAVLFAACPTGINAFLIAERYRSGEAVTAGAITLTTSLAILTMTVAVSVAMRLAAG